MMLDAAIDLLRGLGPEQFARTFWILLFVDLPRFFLSHLVGVGAYLAEVFLRRPPAQPVTPPGVAAIVAGHNAGAEMERTVLSLREQSHRPLTITVVDDGSTDDTAARCRRLKRAGLIDRLIVLRARGGKAAAVNAALRFVDQPLVLVTDADTTFDRDAVAVALRAFADPAVGAVGGHLRVRNAGHGLITGVQQVNYTISIMSGRVVRDMMGFFFVAAGAFGLYRTRAVRGVGGWDFGPGEDGDIMTRLRLAGWRARFEPLAVARTDVPETLGKLVHQRLRWNRSLIRLRYRKHRRAALSPRWQIFDPWFALGMLDAYVFTALVPFLFTLYVADMIVIHGAGFLVILFAVQLVYIALELVKWLGLLTLSVDRRADLSAMLFVPAYSVINVWVLRFVRLAAVADELVRRGSYRDPYVPAKVRRAAPRY